jgi:hypothetical protein
MARVGRATDCQLNDGGDTAAGPDLPPEAIRVGPPVHQCGQTGQRFGGQATGSTRVGTRPPGLWSPVAGARHPLTDRALADAQGGGDLALGPARLLEPPGLQPSAFLPMVKGLIHASQCITVPPKL